MKIQRSGSAQWRGGLKDGIGAISTQSGALKAHPYGFASRFEGVAGTNPEELIGAAHAGCFTMALSLALNKAGFTADQLDTKAVVTLEQDDTGFVISSVALTLEAKVPNIEDAQFQEIAADAKANCPVSRLLDTEITLKATLA
ncbi:MAG: OsmC family peroxiredoxin [Rhodanobacter denitrificans]|uniref:OsmC family peroxiredoxin n=1 Tax=Rhodanobacter denitrificans TaxID=666685 RepID=A0A2W5KRV6_9GAMM|nr:MAG: OsmC family peroxiredoxin [Rhodanobacter denitrificans]